MAHPQSAKVSGEITQALGGTEYACSSLEPLSGGTANFIFKGILTTPLPDGTKEVAVKHGEAFVASMPDFQLSTSRCRAEVECLKAFGELRPPTATDQTSRFTVRAPRLHYFSAASNTQVQEYLPNALSLKDYALKHFSDPASSSSRKPVCLELGRSLGGWLRAFHQRASSLLPEVVKANEPMQQLKHYVNYGTLVDTVANFPSLLGDARETFEEIKEATARELQQSPDLLKVIHGDFWTGNALLPDKPLITEGEKTTVFIVDWEMCQLGAPAVDLGQMIAELYELVLFKGMDEGRWLIEGFVEGYGHVDDHDEFAFRTALHVGTHLVAWGGRVPGWGSETQVQQVVGVGKEVILHAWHKDRAWFKASDLACLFGSSQ